MHACIRIMIVSQSRNELYNLQGNPFHASGNDLKHDQILYKWLSPIHRDFIHREFCSHGQSIGISYIGNLQRAIHRDFMHREMAKNGCRKAIHGGIIPICREFIPHRSQICTLQEFISIGHFWPFQRVNFCGRTAEPRISWYDQKKGRQTAGLGRCHRCRRVDRKRTP